MDVNTIAKDFLRLARGMSTLADVQELQALQRAAAQIEPQNGAQMKLLRTILEIDISDIVGDRLPSLVVAASVKD